MTKRKKDSYIPRNPNLGQNKEKKRKFTIERKALQQSNLLSCGGLSESMPN
jgi:hypothetical protein